MAGAARMHVVGLDHATGVEHLHGALAQVDAARLTTGAHLDARRQRVAERAHAARQDEQLPAERVAQQRLAERGRMLLGADVEERLDAGAQQILVGRVADRAHAPALDRLAAVEPRQARLGRATWTRRRSAALANIAAVRSLPLRLISGNCRMRRGELRSISILPNGVAIEPSCGFGAIVSRRELSSSASV